MGNRIHYYRAMSDLRFENRVVIITGAGGGLGKSYAQLFASRGAKVVVNDFNKANADAVVDEIKKAGGEALANYDSVTNGAEIVKKVMDKYGRVDVLINNAGILRDKSFKAMTDKEWDAVVEVHVKGAFSITKACWPIFRKQKFGRIINTASAAGIYGSFGQANYSSAKFGLVSFAYTLAKEGAKYNINANSIAPIAASPMTATIMPADVLENLKPGHVAPVVAWLCHESCKETGQLYETGAGWSGLLRWETARGGLFKVDDTFTPSAVAAKFNEICDFTNPNHPTSNMSHDKQGAAQEADKLPPNKQGAKVDYTGKVVVVTGAGGGIGRAYAVLFAKLGASVVVNDYSEKNANAVVDEIKKAGGKAVTSVDSVVNGGAIIQKAVDSFGTVHVIVNNAGILRDKSFTAMTEKEWDDVMDVHLKGAYATTHAAWPIMQKQKYGRIINTSSTSGIYGNFGQTNYATAKSALIGFTKTLALEGKKYGIIANCVAPTAGTSMTATIWGQEQIDYYKPDYLAPFTVFLASEANTSSGGLYEISRGWSCKYRWQRTAGYAFSNKTFATPEQIRDKWSVITRFDSKAQNPETNQEGTAMIMANMGVDQDAAADEESVDTSDPEDSEIVAKAKKANGGVYKSEYSYTERDCMLYNLGIGASEKELKYTFEGSSDFQVIPTFGVIPQFAASSGMPLDWLPNFSPMMLLHGEQYLSIKKPIPTNASVRNESRLLEVLDKGKAASVTSQVDTYDKATGEKLFHNTSTTFIRGAGGFGGKRTGKDRGPATAVNKPPNRKPDAVSEYKTLESQAAIYRLSGDYNPLHIDPEFAAVGGFKAPILHGLCFWGIAGKAIVDNFGMIKDIKVRFAGSLYPGETCVTSMWKEGDKVIFTAACKERNTIILSAAAATLA